MNKETLKEIMDINPDDLKLQQANAMKRYVLGKLDELRDHIENDRINAAREMLEFSPAGDGYGSDNYYLDLDYTGNRQEGFDLYDAMDVMEELETVKMEGVYDDELPFD